MECLEASKRLTFSSKTSSRPSQEVGMVTFWGWALGVGSRVGPSLHHLQFL